MEESRPAAEPVGSPQQTQKPSTAKLRRLQGVLLSLRPSPPFDLVSSHRQPDVGEQRVVARSASTGATELFVPGILQPNPRVEPRPSRRKAADEWNVGDFRNLALGIRTQKRAAPSIEILPGQHYSVVVAIGQGCIGPCFVELVGEIRGAEQVKAGIKFLLFVNVGAAQREPEIAALI